MLAIVIEHVCHRVVGPDAEDPRIGWTTCGKRFQPAHPDYQKRDIAHHEPETSKCKECYP